MDNWSYSWSVGAERYSINIGYWYAILSKKLIEHRWLEYYALVIDGNVVCTIDPSCFYKWYILLMNWIKNVPSRGFLKRNNSYLISSILYCYHKQIWDSLCCKGWLSILLVVIIPYTISVYPSLTYPIGYLNVKNDDEITKIIQNVYLSWDHPRSNTLYSDLSGYLSREPTSCGKDVCLSILFTLLWLADLVPLYQ